MSEAGEFLVFLSALRETPRRLSELGTVPIRVWEDLIRGEATACARLELLLGSPAPDELPEAAAPPQDWETSPASVFGRLRDRLLELLDTVGGETLHRTGTLPSGKTLDPWRLAGELAQRDVATLARLRNR